MGARLSIAVAVVVLAAGCLLDQQGRGTPGSIATGGASVTTVAVGGAGGTGGMLVGGDDALGGAGGVAGGGGEPPTAICGNGVIEGSEVCDDGNMMTGDGCVDCAITSGFTCVLEPSKCVLIEQVLQSPPALGLAITDQADHYDGTIESMDCVSLQHTGQMGTVIDSVRVEVGIDHSYAGDLILKVRSPEGWVLTLVNRPGANEPGDRYAESPNGDSSDLASTSRIAFDDASGDDAETMGDSIGGDNVICADDSRCTFHPNAGTGPGVSLADFDGQSPVGVWQFCAADGDNVDAGTIDAVRLIIRASAP